MSPLYARPLTDWTTDIKESWVSNFVDVSVFAPSVNECFGSDKAPFAYRALTQLIHRVKM